MTLPFDAWASAHPAFRRLLAAANEAARHGGDRYTQAHRAVLEWRPAAQQTALSADEIAAHIAFGCTCERCAPIRNTP